MLPPVCSPSARTSAVLSANTGYLHEEYAASFSDFGRPVALPRSGGAMLERSIADTGRRDAMGPYPLFFCRHAEHLDADLRSYAADWVSVTCVIDPFCPIGEQQRAATFDRVRLLKTHWLVNLNVPYEKATSKHHRYYARYAGRQGVSVHRVTDPPSMLDTWVRLYDHLIERHDITGIQAFSYDAFAAQLRIPGMTAFAAVCDDRVVGMHLWYEMGDVAYSHLTAMNATGYDRCASYGLHRAALDHFRDRTEWLHLGGGAGGSDGETLDGLSQFKKGWSTDRAPSYLCGRILQPETYNALAEQPADPDGYFPAYRAGELT